MTRDAEMPMGDYLSLVEAGLPTEDRHQRSSRPVLSADRRTRSSSSRRIGKREGYRDRWPRSPRRLAQDAPAATTSSPSPARTPRPPAPGARPPSCARGCRRRAGGSRRRHRPALDAAAAPHRLSARPRPRSTPSSRSTAPRRATARRRWRARRPDGGGQGAGVRRGRRTEDDLPNALLVGTIAGFVQPDQRDLHRAFLGRYFDSMPSVWAAPHQRDGADDHAGLLPDAARRAGMPRADRRLPRPRRRPLGRAPAGARGPRRHRALAALPAQGCLTRPTLGDLQVSPGHQRFAHAARVRRWRRGWWRAWSAKSDAVAGSCRRGPAGERSVIASEASPQLRSSTIAGGVGTGDDLEQARAGGRRRRARWPGAVGAAGATDRAGSPVRRRAADAHQGAGTTARSRARRRSTRTSS